MYKSFLSWEMGIEKMVLFIMADEGWICTTHINYENDKVEDVVPLITSHKRLYTIKVDDPEPLRDFDIIIPVFHKDHPIAYSLIGGIKDKDDLFNKIQFITTITNIIAVAIENKRLFKRQLEQEKYKTELLLAQDVRSMLIPDSLLAMIGMPFQNLQAALQCQRVIIDYIKYDDDRFAICMPIFRARGWLLPC
ncbi:MAG: GAF domain-containing protein [Saprospiraceae bacterium]|nr:GAF domain-containing protein [Saprospiraceae bacterium]